MNDGPILSIEDAKKRATHFGASKEKGYCHVFKLTACDLCDRTLLELNSSHIKGTTRTMLMAGLLMCAPVPEQATRRITESGEEFLLCLSCDSHSDHFIEIKHAALTEKTAAKAKKDGAKYEVLIPKPSAEAAKEIKRWNGQSEFLICEPPRFTNGNRQCYHWLDNDNLCGASSKFFALARRADADVPVYQTVKEFQKRTLSELEADIKKTCAPEPQTDLQKMLEIFGNQPFEKGWGRDSFSVVEVPEDEEITQAGVYESIPRREIRFEDEKFKLIFDIDGRFFRVQNWK